MGRRMFVITLIATMIGAFGAETPPKFPESYIAKAMLFIPYSEIKEPIFAWYDGPSGSSRIDYYGGMVKTYQISGAGEFGKLRKIAPITTEEVLNQHTCLEVNGTLGNVVTPQTIVPNMKDFKYVGEEMAGGMNAEKWQYINTIGDKVNKYTMYIRYEKSSEGKIAIPIEYIMRGYNTLLGSHYDHYWIEYESFTNETPNPSVFDVTDMTCREFPGPGAKHFYTFNPMKEFVEDANDYWNNTFNDYITEHDKRYNVISEKLYRQHIYKHNVRFINSHNRANRGYTVAVNHLADRNEVELKVLRGRLQSNGYNGGKPFPYDSEAEKNNLPEVLDWRIAGAVTPVKDQSVCGSCWSFGTTGAIEGEYFVKFRKLLRLSQQALIDCSWGYGNNGCDGGEDFRSYQWILKHGGLPTEEDYGPYYGQDGYCHVDNVTLNAPITGWVNVTTNDSNALKLALFKHGPISISIDASQKGFSFYSNGIFYDPNCHNKLEELDHAVLLVGYGKIQDQDYWLVKNSWSNLWGNDGYILMSPVDNNCGVMTAPTYVTFD